MNREKDVTEKLIDAILDGIQDLRAKDITLIDLASIQHTECGYFIICSGTSSTHVDAISHAVERSVKEKLGQEVWHRDGYKNAYWILLDYGDVMVHVFQKETRDFYNLEELWADAKQKIINEVE